MRRRSLLYTARRRGTWAALIGAIAASSARQTRGASIYLDTGDHITVDANGTRGLSFGTPYSDPTVAYEGISEDGTARLALGSGGTVGGYRPGYGDGLGLVVAGQSTFDMTGGSVSPMSVVGAKANALVTGGTVKSRATGNSPAPALSLTAGFATVGGSAVISGVGSSSPSDSAFSPVVVSVMSTDPNFPAVANLVGGRFATTGAGSDDVGAFGSSATINVSGGDIIALATGGHGLRSTYGATINLFGTSFTYTPAGGVPTPLWPGTAVPANTAGTIAGTLADGTSLATTYDNLPSTFYPSYPGGTIRVVAATVPEPALASASAVATAALVARDRRRRWVGRR